MTFPDKISEIFSEISDYEDECRKKLSQTTPKFGGM